MQQQVRVLSIYPDGTAEVAAVRVSACSGDCHKCSGCGAQTQQVRVRADNPIGAVPGDSVIVESDNRQVLGAMLVVYILPLVLLIGGYFAGYALSVLPGLFALLGFLLGILIILIYNRRLKTKHPVHYVISAFAEEA